jgi:DNA-binding CsgD family transcriptional regulator
MLEPAMLEPLGLDKHSERVYVAILSQPGINAGRLAEKLDLPPREVQGALDRLKRLTLLQTRPADEGLHAISPEHGMEILLAVQEAELASFQQRVELSRAAAARLIAEHIGLRPDNGAPEVEYLAGIDAIRSRLGMLSASVRSEVMNFSPTKQAPGDISAGKAATVRYAGTKVRSRSIYSHSALRDPATLEYIQWLVRNGFELRSTPALPSRMVIFDRKIALLPTSPDDSREGAVVLYGTATVTAFCALFDWIWERAIPVDPGTEKSDDVGEAIEIEVILLLAQGYTDETVAKRLSVSPRTSRRIVNSVMRRLGAHSRFQAGVYAERSGLLDRSPLLVHHHGLLPESASGHDHLRRLAIVFLVPASGDTDDGSSLGPDWVAAFPWPKQEPITRRDPQARAGSSHWSKREWLHAHVRRTPRGDSRSQKSRPPTVIAVSIPTPWASTSGWTSPRRSLMSSKTVSSSGDKQASSSSCSSSN